MAAVLVRVGPRYCTRKTSKHAVAGVGFCEEGAGKVWAAAAVL